MGIKSGLLKGLLMVTLTSVAMMTAYSQGSTRAVRDVMWSDVNVASRNLLLGPGGAEMRPDLRRVTFIKKDTGGNNLKYRIKDAAGREWVAKIADESRPEVAAARLLWAIGYRTEINYIAPVLRIPGKGTYRNASLEARPSGVDREERWRWAENPFTGTREFQGLKIMMAMINNWDLKDDNNLILRTGAERQYIISDLGSSFGKLPKSSKFILNRFGRSVDVPSDYARSEFIKGVTREGTIDFAYKGKAVGLFDDISVADARWIAGLLSQVSDRQLRDAFKAANYSPNEIGLMVRTVKARIRALNRPGGRVIRNR
jgi:hypothetical protein